jgi:tRNA C32,U32 (ribose-2'-O)-methylase TrmJ
MTLLDTVTKLRAHCAQEPGYFAELERLLNVLDFLQEGDAKRLAAMLRWRVTNEICNQEEIDMLDRLHTMCCKMEAESP